MAANLQVISGRLRPDNREGELQIEFGTDGGAPAGPATLLDLRGEGRPFRSRPHVIISLTDATLSTHNNTFYKINWLGDAGHLTIKWKVNAADADHGDVRRFGEIDFLAIGERG